MTEPKKASLDFLELEDDEELGISSRSRVPRSDTEVQNLRQQVGTKTTYISDFTDTGDLLANSQEYKNILAIHSRAELYRDLSFSQVRRNILNIIDTHWDIYKRKFNIPDRLVALKFTCLDGDFYLGLNDGYLCFYKDPDQRYRTAFPLVEAPFGVDRVLPN